MNNGPILRRLERIEQRLAAVAPRAPAAGVKAELAGSGST